MKTNEPNLRKWQKNPNSGPDFGLFGPNLGPQLFFRVFYLNQMLYIAASFHFMQCQGQLMNQTRTLARQLKTDDVFSKLGN